MAQTKFRRRSSRTPQLTVCGKEIKIFVEIEYKFIIRLDLNPFRLG